MLIHAPTCAQFSTTTLESPTARSTEWELLPPLDAAQRREVQRLRFEIHGLPKRVELRCWRLSSDGTAAPIRALWGTAADLQATPLPAVIRQTLLEAMLELTGEPILGALERWEWITDSENKTLVTLTRAWRSPHLPAIAVSERVAYPFPATPGRVATTFSAS